MRLAFFQMRLAYFEMQAAFWKMQGAFFAFPLIFPFPLRLCSRTVLMVQKLLLIVLKRGRFFFFFKSALYNFAQSSVPLEAIGVRSDVKSFN